MTKDYAKNSRSQRSIGVRAVLPLVRREARKRKGAAIVELGCGPGTLLAELARTPDYAPLGLDQDALAVALARKAGLKARRADFRRIPAALVGRFAIVYSNEALHWTPAAPARFRRASWFYRFLPAALAASFRRWGAPRFVEGLRGAADLLEPNGVAVLQFGGHGQLQALFESFALALDHPRFKRYRGILWNPTYYPEPRALPSLLARAGLRAVRIRCWNEGLSERSAAETLAFVRAASERVFLVPMRPADRELFYERLAQELRRSGIRRIRWRRTLVVARPAPVGQAGAAGRGGHRPPSAAK